MTTDLNLTADDRTILFHLARVGPQESAPSAPDISVRYRQPREWARPRLVSMAKKGLVEKLGKTVSNADTWKVTDLGKVTAQALIDETSPNFRSSEFKLPPEY